MNAAHGAAAPGGIRTWPLLDDKADPGGVVGQDYISAASASLRTANTPRTLRLPLSVPQVCQLFWSTENLSSRGERRIIRCHVNVRNVKAGLTAGITNVNS
ncbi:hypothetical protein GGD61_008099 [Bradyrhizobium sp. SBR1B]|nr:hypothetical protein [Bradyrhizobium sp. SBR1B]